MTDAEVICEFMEPRPERPPRGLQIVATWWKVVTVMTGTGSGGHFGCYIVAPLLDVCPPEHRLGLLHDAESRLTDEQWEAYGNAVVTLLLDEHGKYKDTQLIHLSADQKIKALASVLREAANG